MRKPLSVYLDSCMTVSRTMHTYTKARQFFLPSSPWRIGENPPVVLLVRWTVHHCHTAEENLYGISNARPLWRPCISKYLMQRLRQCNCGKLAPPREAQLSLEELGICAAIQRIFRLQTLKSQRPSVGL